MYMQNACEPNYWVNCWGPVITLESKGVWKRTKRIDLKCQTDGR